MTAKAGFYGRDDDSYRKNLIPNSDEKYFMQINQTTGEMEVWNEEFGQDRLVGTLDKDNNIEFDRTFTKGARDFEEKFLATADGKKEIRKFAEETIIKDLTDPTITDPVQSPEAARENANEFLDTQKMSTPPDADAADVTSAALDDLPIKEVKKTRRTFGEYRYPINMDKNQDVMKFTMLKYETKDLMKGGTFGFGNRDRVGPEGGARSTGTVVLPIQSGIKDQNAADWGDNKMNAVDAAKASVALGLLGDESEADAVGKVAEAIGSNSAAAKEGIKQLFAAKAAGVTGLIKRTKGATINPNLELLFNEPTLRPFSFSFKLSARSKLEAETIVKIIRFFKQGMAPIRTESNLFLLAPHTFQIHYLLRGAGEHPYIGKMKECALLNMTTDYTPENNYSTLKDGFMTSYTITMEFKELEPIFNDDYEDKTEQQFASFREDPAENAKLQEDFARKNNAEDDLSTEIGF
jgi:hypothetical protein